MVFTATERLWLTKDGRVVKDGDVDATTLLIGPGGQLSEADARKYGLLVEEKAETSAPETKAVIGPPENKSGARGRRL